MSEQEGGVRVAGGLVGSGYELSIKDSVSYMDFELTVGSCIGGFVGSTDKSTVTDVVYDGTISFQRAISLGGIIGCNDGHSTEDGVHNVVISNATTKGKINQTNLKERSENIGGIIGQEKTSYISNALSAMYISTTAWVVGGVVGYSDPYYGDAPATYTNISYIGNF